MVISVNGSDLENKSLNELIKERQNLMYEIMDFENKYILKTKKIPKEEQEIIIDPSPTVIWRTNIESLDVYNKVIDKKTTDESGMGIDF